MESAAIHARKKTLFAENQSSIEPNIVEIPPHAISDSHLSSVELIVGHGVNDYVAIVDEKDTSNGKGKVIVGHEVVVEDVENVDGVVIIDDEDASKGKGKKPMLNNLAGPDVSTLDGVIPSPQATEIGKGANGVTLSASAAIGKHAVPASSFSLSETPTYSNVNALKDDHSKAVKSKSFFKSLFSKSCFISKFACFGPKLPSFSRRATSSHVEIQEPPSAFATEEPAPPSTDGQGSSSRNSILNKLKGFKNFDISVDHSGHCFEAINECSNPSDEWVRNIADEWRMLNYDLPDTIYVRAYEARMDLLRAVMVGADGTPYHDGLFFFDVQLPASYPNVPPAMKYHAHGLRINHNIYQSGDVCLNVLGTWNGTDNESWRPAHSNMLQVLVSIQGLVLAAEPLITEPEVPCLRSSLKLYREHVFIQSLQTMLYTMSSPPKLFEDLVYGHFYTRAHDILAACRAYLDGVEVGFYVKGKPQVIAAGNTCSLQLKRQLPYYIKGLLVAFSKIGVKDIEKYAIAAY